MTERRRFIATASGAVAAVAAAAIVDAPNVIAQPKVQWRMSTAWTPALDVLQGAAQRLAKVVEEMSGGRFRIEVFPGGQIMPPFDCFDAASKGTIEAFMAVSRTTGPTKEPAIEWFATVPFGMNPEGMAAWYYQGDGLKLWEEAYAAFNLVPRPARRVPRRWPDGSGRRSTRSATTRGSRCALAQASAARSSPRRAARRCLTPAREIYAALERGVIDACEWVGPHDDMKLGLHKTARYYYYPGWHEPGTTSEFGFNKKAYEALPVDLRRTLDHAAAAVQVYGLHGLPREERDRARATQDGVQGQGRGAPAPGAGAARSQEAGGRGRQEESEKTPWPGRCTRPSRSSRRWWAPGTTSPKAPTISSSRCEEGSVMTERRRFIAKASGAVAAVAAAAIVDAPNVIAQPKVQWRMSTAWTPALDVPQGAAQRLAKIVEEMSGGRFRIEVFPGGQIMPPLDCFDATSKGTIEAFMAVTDLLGRTKRARARVVHDRSVRHEPRGHGGLVLPGRRAQALGGDVRRLQPRAAPRPGGRSADGRMVPEEDQHDRRLQGAQDAHGHGPRPARSSPRRVARRSSPRAARSTPRSSGA